MAGILTRPLNAQPVELWRSQSAQQATDQPTKALRAKARNARYLIIDDTQLSQMQAHAKQPLTLRLPGLDNSWLEFELSPAPVMAADLAARYPNMMSYSGQQIDEPRHVGRFSVSPKGFFGFYRVNGQWLLLSPLSTQGGPNYISYRYADALPLHDNSTDNLAARGNDQILLSAEPSFSAALLQKAAPTGEQIRTYRLALSATGQYTQRLGGTQADVVEEMLIVVNRINQITLNDLAIQFELVDNHDVIFIDPDSDPYTNSDAASDVESNQTTLDTLLGPANYDIGHLLSTQGGGLAAIGSICRSGSKAIGTSGGSNPQGERFYIDYLLHEIGHQLGARHSFNALDQRNCDANQRSPGSAVEPGSGSTIMSYAGLCSGQNIKTNSDAYFHAGSIDEIRSTLDSRSGQSCGTVANIDNAIPQIQLAAEHYSIPANTPFVLSGTATDQDNDPLVYSWEQVDAGGSAGATANATEMASDNGHNPLFRSFAATREAERYFPQLSSVLSQTSQIGEVLPSTERTLTLRLTVRDNRGGVNSADVGLAVVDNDASFAITSAAQSVVWQGLSQQTIIWDVAQTTEAPISCPAVDILLSGDPSRAFSYVLASATDNDGEQQIQLPNIDTDTARLMIKCSNNVFYAVNNADFSIEQVDPIQPVIIGQVAVTIPEDSSRLLSVSDLLIEDADSVFPDDFTLSVSAGDNYQLDTMLLTPQENFNGQLQVNMLVNDGLQDSEPFTFIINVTPVNDAPLAVNDSVRVAHNSAATLVDVLSNDSDIDNDSLSISRLNYTGAGTAVILNQQIRYQPARGFSGSESLTYTLSDGQLSVDATLNIRVDPPTTDTTNSSGGGGSLSLLLIFVLISLSIRELNPRFKEYHD